jgi:signal transduction histidine kinase
MTGVEELRALALFDGLSETHLHELLAGGEVVGFEAGEEIFREATSAASWWVILDGEIELLRIGGHEETVVGTMDVPGQWAGGFLAWDANGKYLATARGVVAGRLLRVPAEVLRKLLETWSPLAVHLIRGFFQTMRTMETMARQREALVALGTLAAGLAHELNNPASAATRAVDGLAGLHEDLLAALRRLAGVPITAEQFIALDSLRGELGTAAAPLGPLEAADREDELSGWLAQHGVERAWVVASVLAGAGGDLAWCDRVAEVFQDDALPAALDWVAGSLAATGLLIEVKESTQRVSALVTAIRSYSQLDRAAMQRTHVEEGLDSTLTMLAHKVPEGVRVVRDYGADVPAVDAMAGELNQVWTNLIDNALDAMDGEGTLTVATRPALPHSIVVEIRDTGPGMPEDVRQRAFEPFYTTKDVGKGTGLGLDISRRVVVDRHGGDISIEAVEGETVLRVRLPLTHGSADA